MALLLHVKVIEGNDIPKMDFIGKADPYCVLSVSDDEHRTQKTKYLKKTYTPVWNEEFHFNIKDQMSTCLNVYMYDHDKGKHDDPISSLKVPMRDLLIDKLNDAWYTCIPVKGLKKGGKLRLLTHLAPIGTLPFKEGSKQTTLTSNISTGINAMTSLGQACMQNVPICQTTAANPNLPMNGGFYNPGCISNPQLNEFSHQPPMTLEENASNSSGTNLNRSNSAHVFNYNQPQQMQQMQQMTPQQMQQYQQMTPQQYQQMQQIQFMQYQQMQYHQMQQMQQANPAMYCTTPPGYAGNMFGQFHTGLMNMGMGMMGAAPSQFTMPSDVGGNMAPPLMQYPQQFPMPGAVNPQPQSQPPPQINQKKVEIEENPYSNI